MLKRFILISAILASIILVPIADATSTSVVTGETGGSSQSCFHHDVGAVSLITSAGNLDTCVMLGGIERTSTGINQVTANFNGPVPIGASVITYSASFNNLNGCTGGSWTTTASNGAVGSSAKAVGTLTMTANDCSGYVELDSSIPTAPVFVFRDVYSINIHTPNLASYVFLCGSTLTASDTQNPGLATCNPNTQNEVLSGTVNSILSGTVNAALSGSVNAALSGTIAVNLDGTIRQCGPSALGTTCALIGHTDGRQVIYGKSGIVFVGPSGSMTIPATGASITPRFQMEAWVPTGITVTSAVGTGSGAGCTGGGGSTAVSPTAASGYSIYAAYAQVTVLTTDTECDSLSQLQVLNGASVVDTAIFSTVVHHNQAEIQAHDCSATALGTCATDHLIIDSWPSLTAAVTNSGTINVVNSGGQTFTVSGSLAVTNSGSLAVTNSGSLAVSGGLTVTDDANGWSINVASMPELRAILSGEVHPCSTAARALDPNACRLDTTAANTNVNNTVGAVIVPNKYHLCGPEIVAGDCTPVKVSSTDNVGNETVQTNWSRIFIDWSPLLIGFGLVAIGEYRSDFITRGFGGVFFLAAGLLSPMPGAVHTIIGTLSAGFLRFCLEMFGSYMLLLMWFAGLNAQAPDERKFRRD